LAKINILLPCVFEQQRIALVLNNVDENIQSIEQQLERLKYEKKSPNATTPHW